MIIAAPSAVSSDHQLASRITTRLAETNRANLRRLSVDVRGGEITLRGSVASFYEKQIALETCRPHNLTGLIDAVEVAASW